MADTLLSNHDDLYRLPFNQVLNLLQLSTVLYYLHETNPDNGLVRDKTDPKAPASIAAVGMALATMPVVVERGVLPRDFAAKITLKRLRYLLESPQGPEPDATGYKGFYYHFLDMETGRRVWQCELSTIDSAFLFAGVLTVATYFDRDTADEAEIRSLADALYRRADWNWACDGGPTLTHGWRPRRVHPAPLAGLRRGLLLYILGLGSPTHPLPPESYAPTAPPTSGKPSTVASSSIRARSSRTSFRTCGSTSAASATTSCGGTASTTSRTAGRRPTSSRSMRSAIRWIRGLRRAVLGLHGQRRPRLGRRVVKGVEREFFDYIARGAPYGPDDGTVAPWVVVASLPFAPEIVLPTIRHFARMDLGMTASTGSSRRSIRRSPWRQPDRLWVTPYYFGIDKGRWC